MDVGVLITRPQTLRGCYSSAWDVKDVMLQSGRGAVSRTSARLPNLCYFVAVNKHPEKTESERKNLFCLMAW